MRIGPVVFWVVVAAVLGVIVVQTRGPRAAEPDAAAPLLLGLDLARVEALRAGTGDAAVSVHRGEGEASWLVTWREGGAERRWPADAELARAGLRVLASAEFAPRRGDADLGEARTLTIDQPAGAIALRWGGAPIAGRVAAIIERDGGRDGVWMEDRLARALERESLLRWRDTAVMATPARPVALEIALPASRASLEASSGVWSLANGARVPLDPARITETLRAVADMRADEFAPAPDGEPAATVRVRDLGEGERTIEVVGAANAAGTRMRARVSGRAGDRVLGPVGIVMPAAPLGELSADPYAYLRGTPVDGDRVDIASIEIAGPDGRARSIATRSIDGWRGGPDPVRVAELTELLTTRRAASVGAPAEAERLGVLRVRDAALPAPLDVELAREGDGRLVLIVRSEALDVAYRNADEGVQALLEWAAEIAAGGR